MDKTGRQKREKRRKDGMRRGILCGRKRKRIKVTMARLGSLQIRLNRETMRMEPAE